MPSGQVRGAGAAHPAKEQLSLVRALRAHGGWQRACALRGSRWQHSGSRCRFTAPFAGISLKPLLGVASARQTCRARFEGAVLPVSPVVSSSRSQVHGGAQRLEAGPRMAAVSATIYRPERRWRYRRRRAGTEVVSALELRWELDFDPITDDYTPEEIGAVELWHTWVKKIRDRSSYDSQLGVPWVPIWWFVQDAEARIDERAPFQEIARWRLPEPLHGAGRGG